MFAFTRVETKETVNKWVRRRATEEVETVPIIPVTCRRWRLTAGQGVVESTYDDSHALTRLEVIVERSISSVW